jgi:hypothetical protein
MNQLLKRQLCLLTEHLHCTKLSMIVSVTSSNYLARSWLLTTVYILNIILSFLVNFLGDYRSAVL